MQHLPKPVASLRAGSMRAGVWSEDCVLPVIVDRRNEVSRRVGVPYFDHSLLD